MATDLRYAPGYAVPPGNTLREALEERGLSQADLSLRTGLSEKTISQIINGAAPITYETAEKLEMSLGIPAAFWNRRESNYREALVYAQAKQHLASDTAWLKDIPVKCLKERKLIPLDVQGADLVRAVLKFFGVSSVETWRNTFQTAAVQYRGASARDKYPGYVATWLRIGELQAQAIRTDAYDAAGFRRALIGIRAMTTVPAAQWMIEVPQQCASVGVAVVFTKEIPRAGVSGATRWITKDKALIQLSLKYKTDDQVWFAFFHEAGHILRHSKKRICVEFGLSDETEDEREANDFARETLIPSEFAPRLPYLRTRAQVCEFAESIGIAPGIVVGRLQHDGLVFPAAFNDLKRKLRWTE